ncbi:hypothetical protein B7463_g8012, partial [Scytalidium lignicola]
MDAKQQSFELTVGLELLETNVPSKSLFLQRLHLQVSPVPLSQRAPQLLSFENIGWYTKNGDWTPELVSAAYNTYGRLIEEQKCLEETGMDGISLAASFANLPSLQSVVMQSTNFGPLGPAELPKDVIELQRQILISPYTTQSFRSSDTGRIQFRNLIRASGVNSLKITDLSVMDDRKLLVPGNLRWHPGDLLMCRNAVAHVRRLYLKLPLYNYQGEYVAGVFENQLGVLMQSMPLLEDLTIVAWPSSSYVPWLSAWEPLQIPILRKVSVQCIDFTEDDLFRYLERHAATLREVELSCIEMRNGSFSSLFQRMRDALGLKRLILSGIFEEIKGSYVHYPSEVMSAIEKFVTRRSQVYPDKELLKCLYEQTISG